MSAGAQTAEKYIASLPEPRRSIVSTVRDVVGSNLPQGYEEGIEWGMIGWFVPLETFPDTYNGRRLGLAALGSHKSYVSLYLNSVYGDPDTEAWFKERYAASGKKLNMGKSCVRFTRIEDLALDVIGETIARSDLEGFLDRYRETRGSSRKTRYPD